MDQKGGENRGKIRPRRAVRKRKKPETVAVSGFLWSCYPDSNWGLRACGPKALRDWMAPLARRGAARLGHAMRSPVRIFRPVYTKKLPGLASGEFLSGAVTQIRTGDLILTKETTERRARMGDGDFLLIFQGIFNPGRVRPGLFILPILPILPPAEGSRRKLGGKMGVKITRGRRR